MNTTELIEHAKNHDPTETPTPTPTPLPELPWITENPYFLDGTSYWDYRPPQTYPCGVSGGGDPYMPYVRMRRGGELRQTFYSDNYGEMDVVALVALARQDTCQADTVQFELCLGRAHDPPFCANSTTCPTGAKTNTMPCTIT